MIKVLQIYDSIEISGGISAVIMGWCRNIDRKEVQMDFLCSWKEEPSYEDEIRNLGSQIWYIEETNHIVSYLKHIHKVQNFFKNHANNYDVIHLHSAIFSYPYLYYAKKYGHNIRIIHVHSCAYGNTRLSSIRNQILSLPMKYMADYYWACSNEAASIWFERRNIANYTVIPNGIDVKKYERNNDVRKKYRVSLGIDDNEIIIGHISNMTEIKNLPFLLDLVNKLVHEHSNIRLLLVGKDILPGTVAEQIHKYNLYEKVINVGVRKDINNIIQTFDLCLMPSISEGYGIVPVEVQACGVPVVMSIGFPSIVCFAENAFRLDLNTDLWLETIDSILSDCTYVDNTVSEQIKNYDVREITANILQLYEQYSESNT